MDAIILAAGNSRRFAGNKLLHEINGKNMYQYILENIYHLQQKGWLNEVIVVTQYEEISEYISKQMPGVEVVMNDKPDWGISHSIKLGLSQMLELKQKLSENAACLFAVSDQPNLTLASLEGFVKAYEESPQDIGICGCGSRMGNPVIFHNKYVQELMGIEGDKGGKQVVMQHLEDTFIYQIPEYQLEDIDVRITD